MRRLRYEAAETKIKVANLKKNNKNKNFFQTISQNNHKLSTKNRLLWKPIGLLRKPIGPFIRETEPKHTKKQPTPRTQSSMQKIVKQKKFFAEIAIWFIDL